MEEIKHCLIFWPATFLALLGFISLNIYLPSLPSLDKVFNATPAQLKLSITLFLIGFSLSQFFWGSLSSRYGRKKTVIAGLIVAAVGTFVAMTSTNVWMFNCARLVEGAGIGSASVLCRALLTDSLDKSSLTKAMSLISSIANIMPALAPIIGGYIILFFSWRIIFLVLFLYTLSVLGLFYFNVPETNKNINQQFNMSDALLEYGQIFKHRAFMSYLIPYIMLSGGMIGYYAATPFIFINALHISAQHYAFFSIITVISYIVGASASQSAGKFFGIKKAILIGMCLALFTAFIFLMLALFSSLSVWGVILPMALYTFSAGIVAPITNASALDQLRHMAGASAAVIGAAVYGSSALCTFFVTSLNLNSIFSLFLYVFVIVFVALMSFIFLSCSSS